MLILIILASAGFIIAREHMTYDADGNLHFDLPWTKGPEPSDQLPETPDVKIQEPEASEDTPAAVNVIQAVQLGEDPAQWQAQLSAGAYNAFAVTMKASDGTLEYPFETSVSGRKLSDRAAAVQEALPQLLDGEPVQHCAAVLPAGRRRGQRKSGVHGPEEYRRVCVL